MAKNAQSADAGWRFVEYCENIIDPTLRLRPFFVETGLEKFGERYDQRATRDLADIERQQAHVHWIEFDILVEIEPLVMTVGTELVVGISKFANDILRKDRCRRPSDEIGGLFHYAGPKRWLQDRVVN